jgi:CubicO group peptidase (beta-lactamase class C family)
MRRYLGFVVIVLCIIFLSGIAAASPADDPESLEAFIDGVIYSQMDEHNIVGATLSIVQDGEIILSKGYGYADFSDRKPVDPARTLFRVGSTGKLFTWTAVMQLVEQGVLDLETDINEYLDFEIPDQLYGAGSDLQPGPITLAHLLTHTPGFEDKGQDLFVLSAEDMLSLEGYLKLHLPARVFPPGEVMAYSNYGAALAGYIVERVSGLPFAEYIENNIFNPLGMQNSTFRQPLPDELAPDMAQSYRFFNGNYYRGEFEYIAALPAGSMSSTADDMANFMIAHLQEGSYEEAEILEEATTRQMHSQLFTQHPQQMGMAYGFMEQIFNNRRVIHHGGNTFLFATGLYLLTEENTGLCVSYIGGTGLEREALFTAFMDRYYPAPASEEPLPPEGSRERGAAYAGEYIPNRSNFTTIEKLLASLSAIRVGVDEDGYLLVNLFGYPQQFVEIEPGVYDNRHTEGTQLVKRIVFVPDSEGRMMACAEGPVFTGTIAPWYGSGTVIGLLVGLNLLLIMTAVAGWIYAAIGRLLRKEKGHEPKTALAARLIAIAYGILLIVFLLGLAGAIGDIDPAYGVPRIFFEGSEALDFLLAIPYLFALAVAFMLAFAIMAWFNRFWTAGGRIHYTLITLSCLGFVWVMFYNNFL